MKNKCKGSGHVAKVTTVFSYESDDGKQHNLVNCPVCARQLKAVGDGFVPNHVNLTEGAMS